MPGRIREHLLRLLLTLLLAAGLLIPLLGALRMAVPAAECIITCLTMAVVLEIISDNRRTALTGGGALGLIFIFWLTAGGSGTLTDIFRAFRLQIDGVIGALPLVAADAAIILTGLGTLISFLCTRKNAGCLGAVLLTAASLLMLWLANRPDLMIGLLPAGISTLTLLVMDRHEEASPDRLLPWATILILTGFLMTPASGIVYPPLKEKADEIRQNVMDRLFFTEPRDVFSLALEGFYPQGAGQLGGPVSPTDHPVMQVSTPRQTYLRGVMMNTYDGRAWRNTLGGRRYLWDASGMISQRRILFDQDLPSAGLSSSLTKTMEVSVRMLDDGTSTLFTPQRIRELRTGGELVPYFSNSSEMFITRNLQVGDTWAVSAPLFQAGDAGLGTLVNAAGAGEDPQWENMKETFTVLPSHLEEPVWQIALDVTAGIESYYEKAMALQTWLSRNYRYALDVEIQPANLDFVTNFLINTREGYCTYFASAMTVLCRMAGLPARYVEGYVAEPNEHGQALVTGLNAHAWTEVYFRGFGWVTFDATPRQSGLRESDGEKGETESGETEEPTKTPVPPEEEQPEITQEPEKNPEDEPEIPEQEPKETIPPASEDTEKTTCTGFPRWLVLLLILLVVVSTMTIRWRWTDPVRREKKMTTEEARFDLWLEEVRLRLKAMGFQRKNGETPMSYTRRLDQEETLPVTLGILGECTSLLHYGQVHALETDTDLARQAAAGLKKAMPIRARLRYAVSRMSFWKN